MGRVQVQSRLGEAMRAEVEFESLTPQEAESLRAAVASSEVYRQSGVDYNPSLSGARVVLQRIAGKRASLRITTERSIQEPFLELILEVNWRDGRLVRNFTLLFDLPPTRGVDTPVAIAPGYSTAQAPAPGSLSTRQGEDYGAPGTTSTRRAPRAAAPAAAPAPRRGPPPPGAPPAPALVEDPYRVRTGDSLSELAQRGVRPAGVSLDRLILAMYRDNPEAFLDGNMHRLRNGVVLSAPSDATIASITDAQARKEIRAQSADFNRYRNRLADMPTERQDPNTRRASGNIQAAIDDRKPTAQTPDKLTLSKPSVKAAADASAAEASREQARKDAETRVAELNRNVQDLARLSGATASAPKAAAGPAASVASVAPPAPDKPASMAMPSMPVSDPLPVAPASAPPTLPASSPAMPVSAAASAASMPASAPPPAKAASKPAPKPPVEAPAPTALMDSLLEDNLPAVGAAGLLIALLAGFGLFRLIKRRRAAPPETSFLESRLKPDSFFGASGGQHIDTRDVPSGTNSSSMMNYSLSQLDAIGDVDPIAEADVYLAYGRDLQAEEILKEAIRTNPERLGVRAKLLEVYAKRRDVKGFEQQALELFSITEGVGEEWARACQMGRELDPENPLYHPEGSAAAAAAAPQMGQATAPVTLPMAASLSPPTIPMGVDDERAAEPPLSSSFDLDLDLDLGMDEPPASVPAPVAMALPDDDATVIVPSPARAPLPPAAEPAAYVPPVEDMLSFSAPSNFGSLSPAAPPPAPAAVDPIPFSNSAFSLDLDLPPATATAAGDNLLPPFERPAAPEPDELQSLDAGEGDIDLGDPLARKLELADEFRQIGDLEGARDLLQEVIDNTDGTLKAKAESMLASLS